MANDAPLLTITSGSISAQMAILPNGVAFVAPVTFNGREIAATGRWTYGISPTDTTLLVEALDDCFTSILMGSAVPAPGLNRQFEDARAAA